VLGRRPAPPHLIPTHPSPRREPYRIASPRVRAAKLDVRIAERQARLAEIRTLAQERDRGVQEILERVREARASLARGGPLVAFVRIPESGGSGVTSTLMDCYPKGAVVSVGNYLADPERVPAKLSRVSVNPTARVAVGKIPYRLFRDKLEPDTRYITILRDPVDRALAQYHDFVHNTTTESDEPELPPAASLEEALALMALSEPANLATRFLSGHPSPLGELTAGALDDAKATLREFASVGIHERLDESLVLLARKLGLGPLTREGQYAGHDLPGLLAFESPAVPNLSSEQRAVIEESNRLDVDLYAFALELFEETIPAADEGFAAELDALRGARAAAAESHRRAVEHVQNWLDREQSPGTDWRIPFTELRASAQADISDAALIRALRLMPVNEWSATWTPDQEAPGRPAGVDPPGEAGTVVTGQDGVSRVVPPRSGHHPPRPSSRTSSPSIHEALGERIVRLANHYELGEEGVDRLWDLAGLVDWGRTNFVPGSDYNPSVMPPESRSTEEQLIVASSVIAHCLAGLRLESVRAARRLADIGSGAGIPGLVLAIALPEAQVTLLEIVPEKCSFLRRAIEQLRLRNVEVVGGDARQWRGGEGVCDVVTSRKVASLETALAWSTPLLVQGGSTVVWPGSRGDFRRQPPAATAGLRLVQILRWKDEGPGGRAKRFHLYEYEKVG
jgi:16S rRNA (guanine527-N7)-methyltransferase